MATRAWWQRAEAMAAGVLLAGALGAWQAARVADRLGFGPSAPAPADPAQGGGDAPGTATRPGRRPRWSAARDAPLLPSPGGPVARLLADGPAAAGGPVPGPGGEARDWSGAIATGLAPAEREEDAAARLAGELRKLGSDLEFSPGLPEPRQQRVAPSPEPWRPDPEALARPPPEVLGLRPGAAPADGGAAVVIRGRHLRPAQVMFGTAAARIVRVAPDEVTVLVPRTAPGEVRVALTNDDGHFALAPEPFTLRR